eukprot:3718340-Prorocentrum_lima.AAC.1
MRAARSATSLLLRGTRCHVVSRGDDASSRSGPSNTSWQRVERRLPAPVQKRRTGRQSPQRATL